MQEGFLGLYKGATPPLLGKTAIHSLMFGGYAQALQTFGTRSKKDGKYPLHQCVAAGVVGGWAALPVCTPVDQVKACLQVQYKESGATRFAGPLDCARKIAAQHGVARGLYRYLGPEALEMTCMGAFFGGYELAVRQLDTDAKYRSGKRSKVPPLVAFLAGGFGGTAFWVTALPIECVKNRLMTQPLGSQAATTGFREAAVAMVRSGGVMSLYRGFAPAILRTFPANGATFMTYEYVMRALVNDDKDGTG